MPHLRLPAGGGTKLTFSQFLSATSEPPVARVSAPSTMPSLQTTPTIVVLNRRRGARVNTRARARRERRDAPCAHRLRHPLAILAHLGDKRGVSRAQVEVEPARLLAHRDLLREPGARRHLHCGSKISPRLFAPGIPNCSPVTSLALFQTAETVDIARLHPRHTERHGGLRLRLQARARRRHATLAHVR